MIVPRHLHTPTHVSPPMCLHATCAPHGLRIVEIGPGRGDFLFHLAHTQPDAHVIGIEIKHTRFVKLLRRRGTFTNLTLLCGDARLVLPMLAAAQPVDTLYINFPDPWPKRKHQHHRLMQPAFVTTCLAALAPGGQISFTTDSREYAQAVATLFARTPAQNLYPQPIVTEHADAYPTYFAQKWHAMGRTIYYQCYGKRLAAQ